MAGKLGEHHDGELRQARAEQQAEGIIAGSERSWGEADLKRRGKNDPDKLEIAARLRRETTLTLKAIAARVHLGTKPANAKLHRHMRQAGPKQQRKRPAGQTKTQGRT